MIKVDLLGSMTLVTFSPEEEIYELEDGGYVLEVTDARELASFATKLGYAVQDMDQFAKDNSDKKEEG